MADPIISFGGVKFNTDDVYSKTTTRTNDGVKYSVFSKNGLKITYPEQDASQNAQVHFYEMKDDIAESSIRNLNNAEIKGHIARTDRIFLDNCNDCKIDVKDEYSHWATPKQDVVYENGKQVSTNQILKDEYDL